MKIPFFVCHENQPNFEKRSSSIGGYGMEVNTGNDAIPAPTATTEYRPAGIPAGVLKLTVSGPGPTLV
jgi:hypothetical protein